MKVAIVGSGIMGRGIAQVSASAGFETVLIDINDDILKEAKNEIVKHLDRNVAMSRMTKLEKTEAISRLSLSSSIEKAVIDTSIVIECVPEILELKQQIFTTVEATNPQIMASNTSSISIDEIASKLNYPGKLIGMHFFNPPPIMKLVEIIVGSHTEDDILTKTIELARNLGKEPIIVKDFPGFASSRLGVSLGLEAIRMLEQDVAKPEDIDKAMTLGYRHPMGPLELTDYIGLDTRLKIAEYLNSTDISPSFKIPPLLKKMVSEGKLGRKTGQGFYTWKEGKRV